MTRRIGSAFVSLFASLFIASAFAPRIALAQTPYDCTIITASQENVCNFDVSALIESLVGYRPSDSAHLDIANGFTTGESPTGYDLRSVRINIIGVNGAGAPDDLTVAIHAAAASGGPEDDPVPNGTLNGTNPATLAAHEYTASGVFLRSETEYFVVLSARDAPVGDNAYSVPLASSGAQTGSTGWSIADRVYSKSGANAFDRANSNAVLNFEVIAEIADIEPVGTPRNVQIAERDPMSTELTVTWSMPSGGGTVTHYDVCILAAPMEINDTNCTGTTERTSGPGNHRQAATSTPEQTHTRAGLDADAEYNIAVRAIGLGTDNESDWVPTALRLKLRVFLESALP